MGPIKTLTYEERAVWGTCPACGAEHGTPCIDREQSGHRIGCHLGRLQAAPKTVRLTPVN